MKSVRLEAILLSALAALMLALAACEYLPFMTAAPPPPGKPSVTATHTGTPTPTPTATPAPRKPKRRKRQRTPTPTPESSPALGAEAGSAVITTGESVAERNEVQRSIARIEVRLSAIKRDKLNAQDGADYDRIKSFVADARAALQEQDDLRARSLVEKASRLAAQLAGRVSSP